VIVVVHRSSWITAPVIEAAKMGSIVFICGHPVSRSSRGIGYTVSALECEL
jgi:hypothetical protein